MSAKTDRLILRTMKEELTRLMIARADEAGRQITKLILDTTDTKDLAQIRAVAANLIAEKPAARRLVSKWINLCERAGMR